MKQQFGLKKKEGNKRKEKVSFFFFMERKSNLFSRAKRCLIEIPWKIKHIFIDKCAIYSNISFFFF